MSVGPTSLSRRQTDAIAGYTAPIISAGIGGLARLNLSCSGALTRNIFRRSEGGEGQNGEEPQADKLASAAKEYDVRLVVLSISGNDLGFRSVILNCMAAWTLAPGLGSCHAEQDARVRGRLEGAMTGVAKAIDEIQKVMRSAGKTERDWHLVVQSYPSPLGEAMRYPENTWERWSPGGCPVRTADAKWAEQTLVPLIADSLAGVVARKRTEYENVTFLDLRDAFRGRGVCAAGTAQVTSAPTEDALREAEWVRYVTTGFGAGERQESLHPNVLGQRAIGRCIAMTWTRIADENRPGTSWSCRNTPGGLPEEMVLGGAQPSSAFARKVARAAVRRARQGKVPRLRSLKAPELRKPVHLAPAE